MGFMNERRNAVAGMGRSAFEELMKRSVHEAPQVPPSAEVSPDSDWIGGAAEMGDEFSSLLLLKYPRNVLRVPRCDLAWAIAQVIVLTVQNANRLILTF